MKYNVDIDLTNGTSHSLILNRINPNSKVLEFGPAAGYMTKYMKEILGCSIYGIEIDIESAKIAGKYCEKMIVTDINEMSWGEELLGECFDFIIFADVLEHLRDPWAVLKYVTNFLGENGTVITSIPNIGHNSVIMELIQGKFEYKPEGLLDSTHIRFFTGRTVQELLQRSGLTPIEWLTTKRRPENTEFKQTYDSFPVVIQDYLENRDDAHVYQYVTFSKKTCDFDFEKGYIRLPSNDNYIDRDYLQIFWGENNQFEEKYSFKVPLVFGNGFINYDITLPNDAHGNIRLDIGNQPLYGELRTITLNWKDAHLTCSSKNNFSNIRPVSSVIQLESLETYRFIGMNNDTYFITDFEIDRKKGPYRLSLEINLSNKISKIPSLLQSDYSNKNALISKQIHQLKMLKQKLSYKHNEHTDIINKLYERDNRISEINYELKYKEDKIQILIKELEICKTTLLEQESKISSLEQDLILANESLKLVEQSFSWRVTLPLRKLKKILMQ